MFLRRKGFAPWRGDGERIDFAANEASSPAEHIALRWPLVPIIKLLNRSAAAERLFRGQLFAWPTVLFCQTWEVPK